MLAAAEILRSISSSPSASNVLSVSPFAGLTVAMGMAVASLHRFFDRAAPRPAAQRGSVLHTYPAGADHACPGHAVRTGRAALTRVRPRAASGT
ncbi:hypothetical protein GCM10020227_62630 [Streptomyces flavovirens]